MNVKSFIGHTIHFIRILLIMRTWVLGEDILQNGNFLWRQTILQQFLLDFL